MKFSASQIQFLMTKMTISDIDAFNVEASQFVPVKKARVVKPVAETDRCEALKKDGTPCCNRKKKDGLCGRHMPKLASLPSALDLAVCSDSDTQ